MFIDDIPIGSKVKIIYFDNSYDTYVLQLQQGKSIHYTMLKPIEIDGKVIRFPNQGVTAEYETEDSGVYRFKPEKIANINFKGVEYLIFVSNSDEKMFNRRQEFRTEFTEPGMVQVGSNTKVYDCFIHDISRSGISLKLFDSCPRTIIGTDVTISFKSSTRDFVYKLNGTIVRTVNEIDHVLLGIQLKDVNTAWLALVNLNERRSLKVRRIE